MSPEGHYAQCLQRDVRRGKVTAEVGVESSAVTRSCRTLNTSLGGRGRLCPEGAREPREDWEYGKDRVSSGCRKTLWAVWGRAGVGRWRLGEVSTERTRPEEELGCGDGEFEQAELGGQ